MLAELSAHDSERSVLLDRATADLAAATALFERLPKLEAGRLVDITRARLELGRLQPRQALASLQRVAQFATRPEDRREIEMLLFVTFRCLKDPVATLEHWDRYMEALPALTSDPHWLKNQPYIERLAQRCSDSP